MGIFALFAQLTKLLICVAFVSITCRILYTFIHESNFFPSLSNTPLVFVGLAVFLVWFNFMGATSAVDVTSPGCGPNLDNIPKPVNSNIYMFKI